MDEKMEASLIAIVLTVGWAFILGFGCGFLVARPFHHKDLSNE